MITSFINNLHKVLGLNARNLNYVLKNNQKSAIRIANNKLSAKKLLKETGLPVPKTYYIIKDRRTAERFSWELPKSFVIKPNKGLGGQGILIIYGKKKNAPFWIKAGQKIISLDNIKKHVFNILEGNFSDKIEDVALFEQRVKLWPGFKPYSYKGGIPDIRVLVYEKVPVMAELRLPTKESDGRANLHLGGIGVGIDMKTGITTSAIQHDRPIEYIPGTRLVLSGIKIPYWQNVLEIAVRAQEVTKLGFLGVDIAIDREKGPVILEINARPGLAIQIANNAPLRERLERVEGLKVGLARRAVRIAQELFGGEVEEELEEISGRKIIGIFEPVKIIGPQGKEINLPAKIDTGAYRSALDKGLAEKLGLVPAKRTIKFISSLGEEERQLVKIRYLIAGQEIETEASLADRSQLKYELIIGRKDLKNFLIDPQKRPMKGKALR